MGMLVQAVGKQQGDVKSSPTSAGGGGSVVNSTAASAANSSSTTSPIPKSPSYHSNLDQAGGKEFSFSKASLETCNGGDENEQQPQHVATTGTAGAHSNLNPFTNMGSPMRPRDRNSYDTPPPSATVQNLTALKGCCGLPI